MIDLQPGDSSMFDPPTRLVPPRTACPGCDGSGESCEVDCAAYYRQSQPALDPPEAFAVPCRCEVCAGDGNVPIRCDDCGAVKLSEGDGEDDGRDWYCHACCTRVEATS